LLSAGGFAVPVRQLDRLDALLRSAPRQGQGVLFSDQAREELGWSPGEAAAVLRALGFSGVRKEENLWRRRPSQPPEKARSAAAPSPFAALAPLAQRPAKPPRRRRRARR